MAYNTDGTVTATRSPFTGTGVNLGAIGSTALGSATGTSGWKPTTTATKTTTTSPVATPATVPQTAVPTTSINGSTLNTNQQALIKKNNPALYNTLYGSTPAEVNVADIGTTGLNSTGVSKMGVTGIDTASDEAELQALANQNPELADQKMNEMGYGTMSARDVAMQNWMEASGLLVGRAAGEKEIKDKMGVFAQEELASKAQQSYEEAVIAQRRRIQDMRQNPNGMSAAALASDIDNFKYESDQNIADLAMSSYYAQGQYDRTVRMAQEAIDAQYKPIEAMMTHFKDMYTMLGDDLTESEKMQFQYQLNVAEASINAIRDAKTEAVRAAGINGATPDVLSAIKNAQTVEDVWTAAGKFGIDPTLKLAQDKFAWDKWFAQAQLNATNAEKVDKEGANMANLLRQTGKLSQAVTDATKNRVGLGAATGVIKGPWGGGLGYAATGGTFGAVIGGPVGAALGTGAGWLYGGMNAVKERENFENDIKLIYSAQALTELGKLGYSLAPITEKEIEIVGSMASNLSSSVRIAEDGSVTISGSTAEFEKNLNELQAQLTQTMNTMAKDPTLAKYLAEPDNADIVAAYNQ